MPDALLRCAVAFAFLGALALAGCGTTPRPAPDAAPGPAPRYERDGPLPDPPPDLDKVPDAEPRVEAIRPGGANKPYEIDGRRYEPQAADVPLRERGLASWYGRKFHGRMTASGERYDMYAMTAAHPTMPLPSYARVRNVASGREVVVRVNDRGPFHKGRVIDLSYTAALRLGLLRGVGIVEVERLTNDDIRTGAWRRGAAPTALASAESPPVRAATPAVPAETPGVRAEAVDAPPGADAPPSDPVIAATPPAPPAPPGYWVQLGAFRQRAGAESLQRQVAAELGWIAPLLAVFTDGASVHRLQAGPYESREAAGATAQRVREALRLVPVIVERAPGATALR